MYGYIKVAAAIPLLKVADCNYNVLQMEQLLRKAAAQGVQILVFPELSVTGYTCMDLFNQSCLLDNAIRALSELVRRTKDVETLCFAGLPLFVENKLMNTAVAFQKGNILGFVPKTYLPNYKEYQEMRWFSSANELQTDSVTIEGNSYPLSNKLLFVSSEVLVGVEICEDLWTPVPPSSLLSMQGANILVNLSASNELIGKNDYLKSLIKQQSARCIAGYIYASAGYGESTTDLVFAGKGFIAENGVLLGESERFPMEEKLIISEIDIEYLHHDRMVSSSFTQGISQFAEQRSPLHIPFYLAKKETIELIRPIDPTPFVPAADDARRERCDEIFHIQINGLAKRLAHTHVQTAVVGVSGGLDSTLALLVTAMTFDALGLPRKQILGVTMPGFGTTGRTYHNAIQLINSLGVTLREISIVEACRLHLKDIGHDEQTQDITYENAQARERTQILMDLANKENGLVIGTGDLSELALGWATYNGDHISMYAVNVSIPKTLVRYLVEWVAQNRADEASKTVLMDIADTPVSPELLPADEHGAIRQKTEEVVGPYELHDFFLYHMVRFGASPEKIYFLAQKAFEGKYGETTIRKWLHVFIHRFFSQQFKRSCLPDGPKVGSISLSPRCDWRMPSDASAALWLKESEGEQQ
ncbi:MAG: NAD(+) synthase [Tannerella sp.]|jgi:NAD+ synthase (glutamine-hydrolysing)|nr:NAD(+) synthase [Tannerella sp.]